MAIGLINTSDRPTYEAVEVYDEDEDAMVYTIRAEGSDAECYSLFDGDEGDRAKEVADIINSDLGLYMFWLAILLVYVDILGHMWFESVWLSLGLLVGRSFQ